MALDADVREGGLLVVAPDAVVCFAGSRYRQTQRITIAAGGALVLLDWVTSGRRESGERWVFDEYVSRTVVHLEGRLVVHDAMALRAADGRLADRFGRYDVLAVAVLIGRGLETHRITAVETGGCPHTAVRDDVSQNLDALLQLMAAVRPELLFVESGGDNLAAQFSRELADFTIYVIDVSGGDKIPRKGGPGITQSDLLVINKTDLAPLVGADLDVMARDSRRMRGDGPFLFAQVTNGVGVDTITDAVVAGLEATRR